MKKDLTKRIAAAAMFAAAAYIFALAGHFIPLPKVEGILSYDPKDSVIVISGFLLGPWFAAAETVIVSFIEMITISGTGPIGLLMNTVSTLAFALPPAFIYKKFRTKRGAFAGLYAGIAGMTGAMLLWNYAITPIYMNVPRDVVVPMLWSAFLPFNLIKSGINAALARALYAPVTNALRGIKLVPSVDGEKKRFSPGWTFGAAAVIVTFLLLLLALAGAI